MPRSSFGIYGLGGERNRIRLWVIFYICYRIRRKFAETYTMEIKHFGANSSTYSSPFCVPGWERVWVRVSACVSVARRKLFTASRKWVKPLARCICTHSAHVGRFVTWRNQVNLKVRRCCLKHQTDDIICQLLQNNFHKWAVLVFFYFKVGIIVFSCTILVLIPIWMLLYWHYQVQ